MMSSYTGGVEGREGQERLQQDACLQPPTSPTATPTHPPQQQQQQQPLPQHQRTWPATHGSPPQPRSDFESEAGLPSSDEAGGGDATAWHSHGSSGFHAHESVDDDDAAPDPRSGIPDPRSSAPPSVPPRSASASASGADTSGTTRRGPEEGLAGPGGGVHGGSAAAAAFELGAAWLAPARHSAPSNNAKQRGQSTFGSADIRTRWLMVQGFGSGRRTLGSGSGSDYGSGSGSGHTTSEAVAGLALRSLDLLPPSSDSCSSSGTVSCSLPLLPVSLPAMHLSGLSVSSSCIDSQGVKQLQQQQGVQQPLPMPPIGHLSLSPLTGGAASAPPSFLNVSSNRARAKLAGWGIVAGDSPWAGAAGTSDPSCPQIRIQDPGASGEGAEVDCMRSMLANEYQQTLSRVDSSGNQPPAGQPPPAMRPASLRGLAAAVWPAGGLAGPEAGSGFGNLPGTGSGSGSAMMWPSSRARAESGSFPGLDDLNAEALLQPPAGLRGVGVGGAALAEPSPDHTLQLKWQQQRHQHQQQRRRQQDQLAAAFSAAPPGTRPFYAQQQQQEDLAQPQQLQPPPPPPPQLGDVVNMLLGEELQDTALQVRLGRAVRCRLGLRSLRVEGLGSLWVEG